MTMIPVTAKDDEKPDQEDIGPGTGDIIVLLFRHWKPLLFTPVVCAAIAVGMTYVIQPTFTAQVTFLPPQQQSSANAVLSSLGALGGLIGTAGPLRTPADQYVSLMQSTNVSERIIDRFKLLDVYDKKYRTDARRTLARHVHFSIGKKDGLITVDVEDRSPERAAGIANRYVDELRRLTDTIAVTEAQQRRKFFEGQLQQTQQKLIQAQQALETSGFSQGALKSEPKAAAETYARVRAEVMTAEVRLTTMRSSLSDAAPEVVQQQRTLAALRAELARLERTVSENGNGPDYVGKYREFKYQETLFELFARQYELARVDESREGGLIQVVDEARPPEKKSFPRPTPFGLGGLAVGLLLALAWVFGKDTWQRARSSLREERSALLRAGQQSLTP
jgi:uncharacterized protein involved in exopolysaccharide biosynthesis